MAANTKHDAIPVGQFCTEPVSYLIFGNDDELLAPADSVFCKIHLYDV